MGKHPEYGDQPGNQEPNTPEVRESDEDKGGDYGRAHREGKHPEYENQPGNQEPNTPGVRESDS
jgi:hypothetical protein